MASHHSVIKRNCAPEDRNLPVQSITVTIHDYETEIDGCIIHRNHALIYLIVPEENSIRLDMVLASATNTSGILQAIYYFYTQSDTSLVNFHLSVHPGLLVGDVIDLICTNGRHQYKFTPTLSGCRFWAFTVIHDCEVAGFLSPWSNYDADGIKERLQYRYVSGQAPERDVMEEGCFF